ncbi:uncharacterized protein LOC106642358 [Copidosoma floridanum]|uniref:uncharacterized protein LOC106642358 n=1 Tax=Copidosoma floridanum TaxID=29053 RepID=UPI0006C9B90B|nr:uncharacterized protein LOC106642358 [Copidosoma floridanum]
MFKERLEKFEEDGLNLEATGRPECQDVSGKQIVSPSNSSTEKRQLALTKIFGDDSPFSSDNIEDVYKRMMDCAQYSLDSISTTVCDNTITVTGQPEEDKNVPFDTMTIPRNILEKYDMEKVEA